MIHTITKGTFVPTTVECNTCYNTFWLTQGTGLYSYRIVLDRKQAAELMMTLDLFITELDGEEIEIAPEEGGPWGNITYFPEGI